MKATWSNPVAISSPPSPRPPDRSTAGVRASLLERRVTTRKRGIVVRPFYVVAMRIPIRTAALGGVIGPAGFIGAWVVGSAVTGAAYSPIDDAISRLAEVGADTRWLMTAGFVTFGLSVPAFGWALRATVPGWAWAAATATGLATLGVAATPLERSDLVDQLHGVFAGLGYVTLAATPLLAARPLLAMGNRRLAWSGVAAGLTSLVALALTTTDLPTGLFQRVGLTAGDLWIIAAAVAIRRGLLDQRRPMPPASSRPDGFGPQESDRTRR
jgi:hypothetical membrane protein